ncbi:sensor histidine kinase [Massilia niabensis]|uniref:Triple tyrosine motif-containing protein n=1 Tax=Massilia niabensis TaxID=544910 RepID=A0ABW0L5I2_9BURK
MRTCSSSLISRVLLLLLVYLSTLPAAHALDPTIPLGGYRHERWSQVDGAPGLIDAIAQTEDGWLWMASRRAGLYRFDGVRFIRYTSADGSRLQNTGISALQSGRNNSLWIGHGIGGLSVLRGGRLHHILTPDKTDSVFAITHANNNSTWIATGRGLFEVRDDKATRVDKARGYGGARSEYVMADSQGRVWAADGINLYVLESGSTVFRRVRQVSVNPMMIEAPDGSVWLVLGKRFERLTPATTGRSPRQSRRGNMYQSAFDADGNVWTGNCPVGLCVVRSDTWKESASFDLMSSKERLDQPWQMTSLRVLSVFVDREHNVWVGTAGGIERLRDQPVHMIEELIDRGAALALPHPDGRIVVLERWRLNGTVGLSDMVDGKLVPSDNPLHVQVMARAPDGSLVLAGSRGIERQYAGSAKKIPFPPINLPAGQIPTFRTIAAGNDELWLRISQHGTWRFHQDKWVQFKEMIRPAIAVGGSGEMYVNSGNELSVFEGDHIRKISTENPDIGHVEYIHAVGEVLVSGTRGNGVIRNNRLELIRIPAFKGPAVISGIARGQDGQYWLNSSQGLLQVSEDNWKRTMRNPELPLKGELFDALDGYTGEGEAILLADTAFVAGDGKLWLAGERGLAWLDPGKLQPNKVTANVEILRLSSGGKSYLPGALIKLGNGSQDVEIDYSSPSLRIPQRVQFRYRMVGVDEQWVDAGARRTAFYQSLAPGNYTFEVVALNENGLPSPQVSSLRLQITPYMTQTWWFYAFCAAVLVLILLLMYRMRMRHLAARLEERFEIRSKERESIARALHDTFLQSLQGLFFSMQAVMTRLPPGSPARVEFDTLLERARRVLAEGRDEVKGLRSEFGSDEDFWEALQRDIALIIPDSSERVQITGPKGIDSLHTQIHHDVYAVVREAAVNALRHTQSMVVIHASPDPKAFVVSVTDRGPGLGPYKAGKHSHYGLQGMREHAAQIGGRLDIEDIEGGGTRVTLCIAAKLAYVDPDKNLRAG